jgi:hypothetical protein
MNATAVRRAYCALMIAAVFVPTIGAAASMIFGTAEVTGKTGRGLQFDFYGGRCEEFGFSDWRDADGALVAREELRYRGDDWISYRLERLNIGQSVAASREGEVIEVEIREPRKQRRVRLHVEGEVYAGPTLITRIQAALPELRRARPVEIQYLVAEQAMVIGLRATATASGAGGLTNVRIEASSALLRPFVPTTWLRFDARGDFLGMQGRLLPQAERAAGLDGIIRIEPSSQQSAVRNAANAPASMKSSCNKPSVS